MTSVSAYYDGLTRKPHRRLTLLLVTAPVMWTFGLIGVFTPMFLLLAAAPFATAAAIWAAGRHRGALGALLATGGVLVASVALTAVALALAS